MVQMPDMSTPMQPSIGQVSEAPPIQQPKPGFFGEGGVGRGIAGSIGDVLMQYGGLQPTFGPMMQAQREAEAKAREYQQRRQDDDATWMKREQWKRDNPAPTNNDTVADYEYIKSVLGEDQAKAYLKNKANPLTWRQGPDGQFYPMTPPSPPPAAPVGRLTPMAGGVATPAQPPFAEPPRAGFVPPMRLSGGAMTSGRRTREGNALVGGVPNSAHLRGEAVDYDGPNLPALLAEARKLPGVRKAFIHDGHVHTEGKGWSAPYYGKNGTKGLKR